MAYKKYLVIASKLDKAGINITTQLSQFRKNPLVAGMSKNAPSFDFYLREEEIISDKKLDYEKISKYDFIIFASKHSSSSSVKRKTLSLHAPGNWRDAKLGGEKGKICKTSALFQKQLFEKLNKNKEKHSLGDYELTLECTHHGPLINKPCVFVEIGSSESEWTDRRAGFVIAKTLSEIIKEFEPNPYNEIAIGIGGKHYCQNFNKIQLKSNVALSHIIPQYVFPLTEEMIKEAISKTEEEIDFFLLDRKGLGKSEERKRILEILDKFYFPIKKTSEIDK